MSDDNQREPDLKVTDRRRFTSDGELLPGAEDLPDPEPPASTPTPPPAADTPKAPPTPPKREPTAAPNPLPNASGMSLEHLVMSLSTSAMLQMGLVEDPEHGRMPPDLQAARQTIDLLGVLEEKTHGNLTDKEKQLLDQVLAELRMVFVRLTGELEKTPPTAG